MILVLLAPVAQDAEGARVLGTIRHHHSALAVSAQILTRIKTETAQVADAPNSAPLVLSAMSLGRVFDDNQIVTPCDLQNGIHVGRLPVEMNGHDRFCAFGDRALDQTCVHCVGLQIDIYEYGYGSCIMNGRDGGNESKGHCDYFITGSDASRQQGQVQSARAGINSYAVASMAVGGKVLFKSC